jgi:hypothetical protein
MAEKIIMGRDIKDLQKYGESGTGFIGKHIVGTGEDAHLTNPIFLDLSRPHVILVCGKRGSGKSYSAGVVAEEIYKLPDEIRQNICVLLIDTMGIYWSMSIPNENEMERLKEWNMKPEGMNIMLFVPKPSVENYREAGVSVNAPFSLAAGDMSAADWITTFGFSALDDHGILLERLIKQVRETCGNSYSIGDIIRILEKDTDSKAGVRTALKSRLMAADSWGLFEKEGTNVDDILVPGRVSVLDVSHYMRLSESWSVRSMVVAILSRRIFQERLEARKAEEYGKITGQYRKTMPMIWVMIDEAHQFVPNDGSTVASEPLLTLIKEGREPGISILMITQRPDKLHPDALSQSDIILSHKLTSKADLEALRSIMQTYMMEDIQEYINKLPKEKGAAIILDDNSERIYPMQVRPRFSWHAGGSPVIIKEKGLLD